MEFNQDGSLKLPYGVKLGKKSKMDDEKLRILIGEWKSQICLNKTESVRIKSGTQKHAKSTLNNSKVIILKEKILDRAKELKINEFEIKKELKSIYQNRLS